MVFVMALPSFAPVSEQSFDCSCDFHPAELRLANRLSPDYLPFDTPWAWDEERREFLENADFLRKAHAWRQAALSLLEEGFTAVLLHSEETLRIAPALFGCWSAGMETLLTSRADAATLAEIRRSGLHPALALDFAALARNGDPVLTPEVAISEAQTSTDFQPVPAINAERELLSLWTSGSTGEPKRVVKRLSQFFTECEAIDRSLYGMGVSEDVLPIVFATVTHQHIYGLLFRLGWPLLGRGLVTNRRHHFPEMLSKAMLEAPNAVHDRRSPLVLISSPAHYTRFTTPDLFASVRERIALTVSSAGPLPEEGAKASFHAFGRTPYEILGSTETGGIAARCRSILPSGEIITPAWRPTPGMRVGLAETSEPVVGDMGLMELSSEQLSSSPEHGADRIQVVETDEKTHAVTAFELLGRADRILKTEGKRFSADAMARAVSNHLSDDEGRPLASDLRVLITKREREETAVVALLCREAIPLVLTTPRSLWLKRLRTGLLEHFDAVTLPRRLRFVTALPVNDQAKVTQEALRALFDDRRPEWLTLCDRTNEQGRHVLLAVPLRADLRWFDGHFPEMPLFPGVATLELVRRAAEEVRSSSASVLGVRNLKFKAPVFPGERLLLSLDFRPSTTSDTAQDLVFQWLRPTENDWTALESVVNASPEEMEMAYDRLSHIAEATAQGTLRVSFS